MGIDPSIILQGQVPQVNPLQTAGQALALKNALLQNQTAQQEYRARQAIGPIYQASIDPETGRLDTNKLLMNASQNQDAAWMAGDLAKQGLEREQTQANIASTNLDIDQKRYNQVKQHILTLQGAFAPLISNPNATAQDYMKTGADLVAKGLATPQEFMQVMQTLPGDPSQLHQWGISQFVQLQDADKQIDGLFGKVQTDNLGNRITVSAVSPLTGQVRTLGTAQAGLSPSDAAGTVPYVDTSGRPMVMSKGEFAGQQPQGGFGSPEGTQPQNTSAPTNTPPRLATGLAPGQSEVLTDAAREGQSAIKAASDYRMNVRPLIVDAQNLIAQGVVTGPNAKAINLAGRFASQFPGVEIDNTAKADVLQKVLEQISQRQVAAIGGNPTDSKLLSAQISTPNDKMSNAGLKAALATVEGQGQAMDMLGQAYSRYLNTTPNPMPFNQFKLAFSKDIDPYVLVLRSLPKPDMDRAMKAMSPQQRSNIAKASAKLDQFAQAIGWQP